MTGRLAVTYHVRSDAASIEARAQSIAVEQSVEMPLDAIEDPIVLRDIVGEVQSIDRLDDDRFAVRIGIATATIAHDAGQLLNMLFGNTSLHDDVVLHDVTFPADVIANFGGPNHGIPGLRRRVGVERRALTCSALKPQGLPPERLGLLAERFAGGKIDYIKDDHGLADQPYSRFGDRVRACAAGVARAVQATGHPTRYVPSLSGNLNAMRQQIGLARDLGLDCVLLAPLIAGFANMQALVAEFPDMAFFAHPVAGWRGAHRSRAADRHAVPPDRGRRRDLSQLRRPFRLFPRHLPSARPQRPRRRQHHAPKPARPRRRHDPATHARTA